ncbi:uncharacterized protein [Argopecten irradians]|uniref:uncharacterized protein n=1 Tax=Argopecten irradians TaxID=31199 RepID=UPI003717910D
MPPMSRGVEIHEEQNRRPAPHSREQQDPINAESSDDNADVTPRRSPMFGKRRKHLGDRNRRRATHSHDQPDLSNAESSGDNADETPRRSPMFGKSITTIGDRNRRRATHSHDQPDLRNAESSDDNADETPRRSPMFGKSITTIGDRNRRATHSHDQPDLSNAESSDDNADETPRRSPMFSKRRKHLGDRNRRRATHSHDQPDLSNAESSDDNAGETPRRSPMFGKSITTIGDRNRRRATHSHDQPDLSNAESSDDNADEISRSSPMFCKRRKHLGDRNRRRATHSHDQPDLSNAESSDDNADMSPQRVLMFEKRRKPLGDQIRRFAPHSHEQEDPSNAESSDNNADEKPRCSPIFGKRRKPLGDRNRLPSSHSTEDTVSNNTENFENLSEVRGNVKTGIVIDRKEWEVIAPLPTKRNRPRCLKKGWHKVIGSKLEEIYQEGCVFSYIYNIVKSEHSRKYQAPFFRGKAQCRRSKCERNIDLIIHDEPTEPFDNVLMYATLNGKVCHDKPERRPLTGDAMTSMARKALDVGIDNVYYENIEASSKHEYELGDIKSCPSKTVLRKAVNEIVQAEMLHKDIIQETVSLRQSYIDDDADPTSRYAGYLQYVAVDPFTVIMFSHAQIEVLVKMARPDIYIDSKGCLIKSFPDQKRPYLYSVVIKPEENLPPLSIAGMVTADHSQPSIIHFLTFFQRAVKENSKSFQPRKVEVDWSWALINSILMAFKCMSVKRYLKVAWDIVHHRMQNEDLSSLTVVHICIARMTKTFCKHARQTSRKDKELFRFLMKSFALLSNETSIESAKEDLLSIFMVLLSTEDTDDVKKARKAVNERYQKYPDWATDENYVYTEDEIEHSVKLDDQDVSITESSPWTQMAEQTKRDLTRCINEKEPSNSFYCPEIVYILVKRFFPIYPLWSGLLLGSLGRYECDSESLPIETNETRHSNANVEAWFRIVKKDILKGKERLRPAKFASKLKRSINARIKELNLPEMRCAKRKRRTIDVAEEKLSRKRKRGKNRYQPPKKPKQTARSSGDSRQQQDTRFENEKQTVAKHESVLQKFPPVPRWGGVTSIGQHLRNTCTIDNFLTIMYITHLDNQSLLTDCNRQNPILNTLLNSLHLMSTGNFADAKATWLTMVKERFLREKVINLYGEEDEMFAGIFNKTVQTMIKEKCSSPSCPHPYIERQRTGIFLSSNCPSTIDQMFREWIAPSDSSCGLTMLSDSEVENVSGETGAMRCTGRRSISRVFGDGRPYVLVLRIADLVRIGYLENDIEDFTENLHYPTGDVYTLVGVTMHRHGHFSAFIRSIIQGWIYYDGLVGSLKKFSKACIKGCTHVNAIYVRGLK